MHWRNSNSKNDEIVWLLLNTIDTMGKDNEKLRERNHQLKATGESQVASLITCDPDSLRGVLMLGGKEPS